MASPYYITVRRTVEEVVRVNADSKEEAEKHFQQGGTFKRWSTKDINIVVGDILTDSEQHVREFEQYQLPKVKEE